MMTFTTSPVGGYSYRLRGVVCAGYVPHIFLALRVNHALKSSRLELLLPSSAKTLVGLDPFLLAAPYHQLVHAATIALGGQHYCLHVFHC
jgi:hypothetical protein